MALGILRVVAIARLDIAGLNVVPFASVQIRDSELALVDAFEDEAGTVPIPSPACDVNGTLTCWIETGTYSVDVAGTEYAVRVC